MFDNDFEVFICDTSESKLINYRTRYQVYCLETEFEDPSRFPDRLERDSYDSKSAHFVVRCKHTGQWVAAARLIFGLPNELPFWKRCSVSDNSKFAMMPQSVELSRLCILNSYRKAVLKAEASAGSTVGNVVNVRARRKEPEILMGLLRAMVQFSKLYGVKNWFAMQSPSLTRAVQLMGFSLTTIGPAVEHRGLRVPVYSTVEDFYAGIAPDSTIGKMFYRKGIKSYANSFELEINLNEGRA